MVYCVGEEDNAWLKCELCGKTVKIGEHITVYGEELLQSLNGTWYSKPHWYCKECANEKEKN